VSDRLVRVLARDRSLAATVARYAPLTPRRVSEGRDQAVGVLAAQRLTPDMQVSTG
jgi:hypothetical protein